MSDSLQSSLPTDDQYALDDYWRLLYSRKTIILSVTLMSGVFAWLISQAITPRYEAFSEFYVARDVVTHLSGPEGGNIRTPALPDDIEIYVGVLRTGNALEAIARKFPEKEASDLGRVIDVMVTSQATAQIYARDSDPKVAADLATAFVDYFIDFHKKLVGEDLERSIDTLSKRLDDYLEQKASLQEVRRIFVEENDIGSPSLAMSALETQRTGYEGRIQDAMVEREISEERVRALEDQLALNERRVGSGQISPSLADSLSVSIRSALSEAEVQRRLAHSRIESLKQHKSYVVSKMRELPGVMMEVDRLDEALKRLSASIQRTHQARDDLLVQESQLSEFVIITQHASPPRSPVFPIVALNVFVALVGGFVVAVLYALLLDYIDSRGRRTRREALRRSAWAQEMLREIDSERAVS